MYYSNVLGMYNTRALQKNALLIQILNSSVMKLFVDVIF